MPQKLPRRRSFAAIAVPAHAPVQVPSVLLGPATYGGPGTKAPYFCPQEQAAKAKAKAERGVRLLREDGQHARAEKLALSIQRAFG